MCCELGGCWESLLQGASKELVQRWPLGGGGLVDGVGGHRSRSSAPSSFFQGLTPRKSLLITLLYHCWVSMDLETKGEPAALENTPQEGHEGPMPQFLI